MRCRQPEREKLLRVPRKEATASAADAPLEETASRADGPMAETASRADARLAAAASAADAPMVETVSRADAPLEETASRADARLAEMASRADAPLAETVSRAVARLEVLPQHRLSELTIREGRIRQRTNATGRILLIPKRNRKRERAVPAVQEQIKVITIPEKLTIGELADAMHMKAAELIKKLFLAGKAMTVNSEVSYEEAENIAADYDILCEKEEKVDVIEELLKEEDDKEEDMVSRPPVICVMGHVDHGKTSILDYIRKSHVTAKEAGGITQAIGAYTVKTKDGRDITFLDTPGHEAFTAMRLRGAQSTDIAVLVVAADDGVMPQTIEAINHAKAAGVEIIVAVNKIDKPDADPDRVKTQLTQYGLTASDWGGQTEFVNVSAKTGQGIDDLLDTILLQADVMELKANPNRLARGLVLEARLDRGRGPVANVLVQKGTLHVGDFVSAGPAFGKVRAMINDKGDNVKEAGPSIPVMVMGLSDVPSAGEVIVAHSSNDEAKSYAETYKAQHKEELVEENRMSMKVEDLFDQMREGKMKELELIVKADVQGSVEALCTSLQKLSNDEVMVKIIHSAVGNISESDVTLDRGSWRRKHPSLQGHLPGDRRCGCRPQGNAGSGLRGEGHRSRTGAPALQVRQDRQYRGLHGSGRCD